MALKLFIGIKHIWYGDAFAAAVTAATLKTWLESATEVKNSHQDTWGYSEDDPSYTDYIDELTGDIYYRDMKAKGAKTISFTMGEYDLDDLIALRGGEKVGTDEGWASPEEVKILNMGVVGKTKTGNYIVFSNAGVIGKGNQVEKNIGLGVTAVAMKNPNEGVKSDYLFYGDKVDAAGVGG